ncbi:MAG TPA: HAMP domain-containing sensor histidine kinase [Kofleriaceae bacterium]|nr:HAMP domain-containing sensor histidine kinase [Kofleriaceae bacterium]
MSVAWLRSLAARVYLFAIVCTVLVVVSHGCVMPRMGRTAMHERFRHDQEAMADVIGLLNDRAAATAAVERIARSPHRSVMLLDANGAVIAAAGEPITNRDEHVLVLPVRGTGELAGSTLLVRGIPPHIPGHALLVVIVVMLLMIAAVSLWFARSLARPLGRLAAAAERIGAGDLDARSGVSRGDELGQVGAAFDRMVERLAALLDANRSLVASVSHELRTPLARIRVALELAAERPLEAQELLAGVGEDLTELEQLVSDILTMTRLAAHTAPPLRRERCEPREVVARAQRRWQQLHAHRELVTDVAADAPAIDADPALLRRVIDNLLDNAAKYSPREQPVALRVATSDRAVQFEVADRGEGLSAEELAHAFTPFWRSDASRTRETGGVGLGLALARQIARAHGGDVTLESEPGRGTRATVRIPVSC